MNRPFRVKRKIIDLVFRISQRIDDIQNINDNRQDDVQREEIVSILIFSLPLPVRLDRYDRRAPLES